jgi:hypothetical protein
MAMRLVKNTPTTPKAKARKEAGYLAFLHRLPCCITGVYGVEAAHLSYAAPEYGHYGRGRGTKASDRWALPLGSTIHAKSHSMSERAFWDGTGINPHVIALTLHGLFIEHGNDAEEYAQAIIMQHISRGGE